MKAVKALLSICAAVAIGAALSGCVVVPAPYWHGGYYHYHR